MAGEGVHVKLKSGLKSEHEYRYIGKPTPRVDGPDIVQGKNIYLEDVPQPHALIGQIKASPYPHAMITRIDIEKALKVPGVVKILTYKDADESWMFGQPPHKPVLDKHMTVVGDAVALIAADTPEHANEASDLIEVEYEVLEPVFDAVAAQADDAPRLYPDFHDHNIVPGGFAHMQPSGLWWHLKKGDADKGMEKCKFVAGGEVRFDKNPLPLPPETPGVVVEWKGGDHYDFQVTSDSVNLHKYLAVGAIPGIQANSKAYAVGGSYGNKTMVKTISVYGVLLARACNRPIKFIMSRAQSNCMYETRLGSTFQGTIGMDENGIVRAVKGLWSVGGGHFGNSVQGQISVGLGEAQLGMAKCPNWDLDTRLIVTNTILAGVVRGYGGQELNSCLTLLMSRTMREGDFEPLQCLRNNFIRAGDRYFWRDGREWTAYSVNYDRCVDTAAEKFGWYKRWPGWNKPTYVSQDGRYRRGLGCSVTGNADAGESFSEAYVRMMPDVKNRNHSTFVIHCNCAEIGNGQRSSLIKMVADILNVDLDDVQMTMSDSMLSPQTEGQGGSRATVTNGKACCNAALDLRQKLFEAAGLLNRQGPGSLVCENYGVQPKSKPELWIPFSKCVPDPMTTLTGFGRHCEDFGVPNFFLTMIEVEVDTETGLTKVVDMMGATDCGQIIDPGSAEMQCHGAIGSASLDSAFFEEHVLDEHLGRYLTYDMINFKWRPFNQFFHFDTCITESQFDTQYFKAVGFGEISGAAAASSAIMAVSNAIGKEILDYPATPDVILRALGKI
jgi:CO/xanthine dehydrogenase Mo-binding subunit